VLKVSVIASVDSLTVITDLIGKPV
jgi:hypothetical protein